MMSFVKYEPKGNIAYLIIDREKALNALDGVSAKVDLEAKTAAIETEGRVSDEQLRAAVTDAGYDVVSLD